MRTYDCTNRTKYLINKYFPSLVFSFTKCTPCNAMGIFVKGKYKRSYLIGCVEGKGRAWVNSCLQARQDQYFVCALK